ncbi:MAG: molybdopterin cofactor-binding domain-containing protein, partial [Isosphaeraceae bacterium]
VNKGDAKKALQDAQRKINATYWVPFVAHATMEPINCTAHVQQDRCDVWAPTQGQTVAQMVVNYLNTLEFPVPGKARGQVPGTDQRNAIAYASVVDLDEAYGVGCHAVDIARQDGNGWMATILRDHGRSGYSAHCYKVPLEQVANSERLFPERRICSSRIDVTDEFLDYAQPLIGEDWVSVPTVKGLPRFARITRKLAPRKLPEYVPQTYRKT